MTSSKLLKMLGKLQLFIGLGAVLGGVGLVSDPSGGNLGIGVDELAGSPFPDYLIPGLFLMIVNGFGNIAAGVLSLRRYRLAGQLGLFFGFVLVAWIVIQVLIFQDIHWLHILYFALGWIEAGLGLASLIWD